MLVHVCHARRVPHLARYTHLPPLTCIPRFLPGEVPRLSLDRADSRGSISLIFVLFRGSFEGNTAIFLAVGRAAELSEVRDPITPVGFRQARRPTDAKCQLEGPYITIVLTFDILQREYPTKLER